MNQSERGDFVASLEQRGWILEDDTVWSPSRGLWFSESHFNESTLEQVAETFSRRADRIEKAAIGDWKRSTQENRDASEAAQELLTRKDTQQSAG